MSERSIRVVYLFPGLMNVYADRGNVIALRARGALRGVDCEVFDAELGARLPATADLVLIGGGQDREQRRIAPELAAMGPQLRDWAEEGVAFLTVCGGFQLFGHWYRTAAGDELPGVGLYNVTTVAPPPGAPRCIGDVLAVSELEGIGEVVGFENHAGRTYLGPGVQPFARVRNGYGNNGEDGTEGAIYREAIGTYLHGSLLPKNPRVTDHLLQAALRHRYGEAEPFEPLPDPYADRAHVAAAGIAARRGRRSA